VCSASLDWKIDSLKEIDRNLFLNMVFLGMGWDEMSEIWKILCEYRPSSDEGREGNGKTMERSSSYIVRQTVVVLDLQEPNDVE